MRVLHRIGLWLLTLTVVMLFFLSILLLFKEDSTGPARVCKDGDIIGGMVTGSR